MSDQQGEVPDDLLIDHEQFVGRTMNDPWDDEDQTDWPNEEVSLDGGVATDTGPDVVAG